MDTRPCVICALPVTRRVSDFKERVYCSREHYYEDISRMGREIKAAGGSWGRPAGPDARPFLCSDGRTRPSSLRPDGYRHIHWPEHPDANAAGRVTEHRLVMQSMLGRRLLRSENVHHRNGIRDDNSASNLELWTVTQPPGHSTEDAARHARSVLGLYGTTDERRRYATEAGELT